VSRTTFGASFAQIDASDDPQGRIAYLDRVAAVPAISSAKAASIDLLGLTEGARALDIGCGPGDDVCAMAHRVGPAGHATGIDNSAAIIAAARGRTADAGLPVSFEVADAAALPFEDQSFDAIRADRTIQHVPDPEAALAEMRRVCAPGGVVVISEITNELTLDGVNLHEGPGAAIVDRFWSSSERRAWLGFMLPLLMDRGGFATEIERQDASTSEFAHVDLILQLSELASHAVREGTVTSEEADQWLARLSDGAGTGAVALQMRFLHFVGRVRP
jgi:ubiquinone/menaquinone biosynthesis C-methylase UbiE